MQFDLVLRLDRKFDLALLNQIWIENIYDIGDIASSKTKMENKLKIWAFCLPIPKPFLSVHSNSS